MEDWIVHDGKRRPVDPTAYVDVRFRSGAIYRNERALRFTWCRVGAEKPSDVVAYRVASTTEADRNSP